MLSISQGGLEEESEPVSFIRSLTLVIISSSKLPWLNILTPFLEKAAEIGGEDAQKVLLAQVTPLNAFLVGYSLDSIIELFGTSIESASQVKSLIRKAS